MNTNKYTGCLKDIEISRTPYNLLSSTDFVGVTKGCALEVSLSDVYASFDTLGIFILCLVNRKEEFTMRHTSLYWSSLSCFKESERLSLLPVLFRRIFLPLMALYLGPVSPLALSP